MSYINSKSIFLLLAVCIFALTLSVAFAHGGGVEKTQSVDGYVAEVGFPEEPIFAGEPTVLFFGLDNESTGEAQSYDSVFVRISKNNGSLFSVSTLSENSSNPGQSQMTFNFPEVGDYSVDTRYKKDGEQIAEANFTLSIEESPFSGEGENSSNSSSPVGWLLPALAGLAVGGGASWFLKS